MMRGIGRIFGAILMGGLLVSEAGAHTQTFTCPSLPSAETFTGGALKTITETKITPVRGGGKGTPADDGDDKYGYAKITVPPLTAGELRIFSTPPASHSNAVLCHDGRARATYRTSYRTYAAHDKAEDKARQAEIDQDTATAAATKAGEEGASASTASRALSAAATDLKNAVDALKDAQKALTDAGDDDNAGLVGGFVTAGERFETAARNPTTLADPPVAANYVAPLNEAASDLGTLAENLRTAAIYIKAHEQFALRAEVRSGDGEYILVVDKDSIGDLDMKFHGVTSSDARGGRLANEGNAEFHDLTVTAPGLLTIAATGSGNLKGELYTGDSDSIAADSTSIAQADGTGTQFTLATPVTLTVAGTNEAYTLAVRSQTRGSIEYRFDVTFAVAQSTTATLSDGEVQTAPTWTNTPIPKDDGTMTEITARPEADERANQDVDVFVFTMNDTNGAGEGSGLLTVNGNDATTGSTHAQTTGTLYGPQGVIATDTNSGPGGTHFSFDNIPVKAGGRYAVRVTGTAGGYRLQFDHSRITAEIPNNVGVLSAQSISGTSPNQAKKNRNRYPFDITAAGTLYLESGGNDDTFGTLYGPNGEIVKTDDNGGAGRNFRIVAVVQPRLYMLVVESKTNAAVDYTLTANFARGVADDDTPDTDGGTSATEVDRLNARIATLQRELDECREPVVTDERGVLGNPPDGGFRSGIGVISGWVCAAEEVTVEISRGGVVRETLTVAYGTSRPDTVGECRHRSPNTGFGMTYNFNHLPEGEHTIQAYADGQEIGEEHTFEVVHLTAFEATDRDRFLRLPEEVQERGECIVRDFPAVGEDTFLLWEESLQNFVIEDAG